jgi:hypothetical protein
MTNNQNTCPFFVGDWVMYKPTNKGIDSDVMSSISECLVSGRIYRVAEIQKSLYIVVEGYKHPGGGIYWTEFIAAPSKSLGAV